MAGNTLYPDCSPSHETPFESRSFALYDVRTVQCWAYSASIDYERLELSGYPPVEASGYTSKAVRTCPERMVGDVPGRNDDEAEQGQGILPQRGAKIAPTKQGLLKKASSPPRMLISRLPAMG